VVGENERLKFELNHAHALLEKNTVAHDECAYYKDLSRQYSVEITSLKENRDDNLGLREEIAENKRTVQEMKEIAE